MGALKLRNHEKSLQVKTTLATEMSRSFTIRQIPWAASAVPGERTVVNWQALKQVRNFKKSKAFRPTYDQVSTALLSLGDAFVQKTLKLHPEV